ncbi:hypothetical protein UP84_17010, partial [Escherichia coli]
LLLEERQARCPRKESSAAADGYKRQCITIDDCWEGWAILLRQKQKKLIMLPSETMIWQPEFTDKTLSRKTGAVQCLLSV